MYLLLLQPLFFKLKDLKSIKRGEGFNTFIITHKNKITLLALYLDLIWIFSSAHFIYICVYIYGVFNIVVIMWENLRKKSRNISSSRNINIRLTWKLPGKCIKSLMLHVVVGDSLLNLKSNFFFFSAFFA